MEMIQDYLEQIANILKGESDPIRQQTVLSSLKEIAENLSSGETGPGVVELATSAEAQAGTDATRAITPATLQAVTATTTRKGVAELATTAETIAVTDQTRVVTPYGLGAALAKMFVISFTGSNLAGPCTATGVAVGDVIFGVTGLTDMGQADAKFEGVVTVVDQIQQSAAENLSAKNFLALVYRPS